MLVNYELLKYGCKLRLESSINHLKLPCSCYTKIKYSALGLDDNIARGEYHLSHAPRTLFYAAMLYSRLHVRLKIAYCAYAN